ncbi:metallophosphoesterase [Spirosoma radiotolerans]|uniref:Metallophosphoesterase n=1 Tax=Spirosoma radiotolerans TaxID=1379870 RepID=A0A0E3ZV12_9BACT|nr:metallophosphoesterase [Spirosoma radiotolerans]AKD54765.1 metallophosphoesterase [Spirosoma radiotolerans]
MNVLTISDLHGRTVWKKANTDAYDRVIFLGDYTDSHVFDDETIYGNLNEVIQCKLRQPDKFVLLIGNHDAQYLHFPYYRCSGFRERAQPELSALLTEHKDLFQIAHQQGNFLFTHAGATHKWLTHFLAETGYNAGEFTPDINLAGLLNEANQQAGSDRNRLFEVGLVRGGSNAFSGPVWADRSETIVDFLTGFQQVVGHTPVSDFTTTGNEAGSITYTDVLQTKTAFYEVIIPD